MEKGKKYIHYCWFGDKNLPRLAKKCIKSWKKYLPDYEIVCWDENNVDLDECPFIKEAYQKKRWAFVADYVRAKAVYEYGGIYLDTDMKINKSIDSLLKNDGFLGVEDSGAIAVGVWWAKEPGGLLAKELLNFYKKQRHFNSNNLYSFAIPVVVTKILEQYGFKKDDVNKIQKLSNGVVIYPREYFYPLSYNYHDNRFTKNTCMVHYYDASWAPKQEKRTIWLIRKVGPRVAAFLLSLLSKTKALLVYYGKILWRTILLILYPLRFIFKKIFVKNKKLENVIIEIKNHKENFVVFTKDNWLGVGSSTEELFGHAVSISEISSKKEAQNVAREIVNNKRIKMIVFSGFAGGWELIIRNIKFLNPELIVKVFWHGSNAMHTEELDWDRFKTIFNLLDNNLINEIAFAKKSMYEQYLARGYKVSFLPNNIYLKENVIKRTGSDGSLRIGIYSSGDRWVKNTYNQLAAASLIDDAEVDVIPLTGRMLEFTKILRIDVDGESNSVVRSDLLNRIAEDDIVLYTSFVECAPILPLECLELGVLCITGDNHHYWVDTPLEKYLIEPKVDNPVAIAKRIQYCIKNKDKILELYKDWKKQYDKYCKDELKKFLAI